MNRVCSLVVVVLVAVLAPGTGQAGEAAVVRRIETLNTQAIVAYQSGDNEGARTMLLDAVVLGKENGLGSHPAVARSYLNLGLIHIEGLKDEVKGERYFTGALRIDPNLKLKSGMASDTVARAFDRARAQLGLEKQQEKQNEVAAKAEEAKLEQAAVEEPAPVAAKESAKESAKDKKAARQLLLEQQKQKEKEDQDKILHELALTREREARQREKDALVREQESRDRAAKAKEEQDKILRELAMSREREAKERAETERTQKLQLQKDLSAAQGREKQEQKDKEQLRSEKDRLVTERDRLVKEKKDLEQQLAEAGKRERKAADDQKRLEREKQDLEKKLRGEMADAEKKLRNQLSDTEKKLGGQLAEAEKREQKEKSAKEKLEEERRVTQMRAQEEKEKQKRDKLAHDKQAEGPAFPGSLPQKLTCSTPDESPPGADVFVHCATQSQLKADELTLFYRPSGSARFHSAPMVRARKGWHSAMIPAALIKGSMLQYYVEAQNERGRTVVANGKPTHPNVLTVNRWPSRPVADSSSPQR
jgi:phosphohistidine swiveling domain-containing protein